MKLGKFKITQELASDKARLDALSAFITTSVNILERIVIEDQDKDKQAAILMIVTCEAFDECPDRPNLIPEYTFDFPIDLLAKSGISCQVRKL